jgi:hypothetical protein
MISSTLERCVLTPACIAGLTRNVWSDPSRTRFREAGVDSDEGAATGFAFLASAPTVTACSNIGRFARFILADRELMRFWIKHLAAQARPAIVLHIR